MVAFFRLDRNAARTFKFLASLSLLYVLPIILANAYYVDDWRRSMSGVAGWEHDGRPLTSRMMELVNFGYPLLDLSPFSLILGLLILCYGLVLFARKHIGNERPLSAAIVLFFFIANPFFLENLSFKYDSLSMCVAAFLMIFIFSLNDSLGIVVYFIISSLCIIATLNIYQPALCIFFCLLFIKFLFDIIHKQSIRQIVTSTGILLSSCLFSLVFYKETTVSRFLGINAMPTDIWDMFIYGYAKMHSSLITFRDLPVLFSNIGHYLQLVCEYIKGTPNFLLCLSFLLIFIFIFSVIDSFMKNYTEQGLAIKISILSVVIFSPVLILLNTFLFMSILYNPVFNCRVMLAFGCILFLISISIYYISKYITYCNILFIPFLMFMFVFSYSYGNAMSNQKNYDFFFVQNLAYDLGKVNIDHDGSDILFITSIGKLPHSKQLTLTCQRFPIMKELFYMHYLEDFPFFLYSLPSFIKYDYVWNNKYTKIDKQYILSHDPVVRNDLYNIYITGRNIIISFDDSHAENNLR